jgi:FkbM family methyltransferase
MIFKPAGHPGTVMQKLRTLGRLIRELNKIELIQEQVGAAGREITEIKQQLGAIADHLNVDGPKPQPSPAQQHQNSVVSMMRAAANDAWFNVRFNGVPIELPRYTLTTMQHCIKVAADGSIELLVEKAHWDRMRERLVPGSLFVDIGAATGAMSIPFALTKSNIRVVAFEPSKRANSYFAQTMKRNRIPPEIIQLMPFAISNAPAVLDFMELPEDTTGDTPFLPEASRIQVSGETVYPNSYTYSVEVKTLDSMAQELEFDLHKNIVIKVDVEGFEVDVIRGALATIKRHRPYFAIDVHTYPASNQMTKPDVISLLASQNYTLEELGHVVLATPPVA